MENKLRVVFMGTPDFSVPVLEGLMENYNVVLVVTQPDKEVGRHKVLTPPPVKKTAIDAGIPVLQPKSIKKEYQDILDFRPDIIITCAYGQIIPKEMLDYPSYGCINVHASLLPKLRGGAPIHRAIMNNYARTGVTIMYMVEKMDAGDILSQEDTIITKEDNLETLHDRLSLMGRDLLLKTLPSIIEGTVQPIPQKEEEVTYAWNIKREEERVDFHRYAIDVFNHIRALSPHPGAYATLDGKIVKLYASYIRDSFYTEKKDGEIARIYEDGFGVSVRDREIVLTEIQWEGKKRVKVKDYFHGVDPTSFLGKVFNEEEYHEETKN